MDAKPEMLDGRVRVVLFSNVNNFDHLGAYGSYAFFDLGAEKRQGGQATDLARGQICVVLSKEPKDHFTFKWYKLSREKKDSGGMRVFFGELIGSEALGKSRAVRSVRYQDFFTVYGKLKQGSVFHTFLSEDQFLADGTNVLLDDIEAVTKRKETGPTTKKALVDARLGQGDFRSRVLTLWGNRCCVTGAETHKAIRASHIKPWRESNDHERLDAENGLPLTANLDALFDAGLVSFDSSGNLLISVNLSAAERQIFTLDGQSLRKKPTKKTAGYLTHHRRKHGFEK